MSEPSARFYLAWFLGIGGGALVGYGLAESVGLFVVGFACLLVSGRLSRGMGYAG